MIKMEEGGASLPPAFILIIAGDRLMRRCGQASAGLLLGLVLVGCSGESKPEKSGAGTKTEKSGPASKEYRSEAIDPASVVIKVPGMT